MLAARSGSAARRSLAWRARSTCEPGCQDAWVTVTRPTWLVSGEMAIVAHRGGAALGPENSIEVLEAAQAAGAAAVEVDVHELGDGSLVLTHDGHIVAGEHWFWIRDLDRA